jgi:hypothetical protein
MGQLLVPAMIGAGVGAVGGAATGQNPFKAALLGAAVGAGGAGIMGAGAGAATTAQTAATAAEQGLLGTAAATTEGATSLAGGGVGNLGMFTNPHASSVMGGVGDVSGLGVSGTYAQGAPMYTGSQGMFDVAKGSTLGGQGAATFAGGGGYDPSFLGRISEGIGNIGNPFSSLTGRDKLGLGLQGVGMLNQPQQMIQPQVTPITRGNPNMVSSPLYNVAPNVGRQEGNDIGLPNLFSKMPLSEEEELLRLQREMQTTGFRGR